MRPERIEELLKAKPPDEGVYRGELVLDTPTARATTAVTRARPSLASAAAAVGTVALVSLVLVALVLGPLAGPSPSPSPAPPSASPSPQPSPGRSPQAANPGVIPWIDATPVPSETPETTADPHALPACTSEDLALSAEGWGGATGSLAGGATVVNVSSATCAVAGRPASVLLDARGKVIARQASGPASSSDVVALPPGGVAGVTTVWQNWCGTPPRRPLSLRLSLPAGGGDLSAVLRPGRGTLDGVPRCDAPGAGSTVGLPVPFSAPAPSDGGYQPDTCTPDALAAYLGRWGAAAGTSYASIVVLNASSFDCLLAPSPTLELRDAGGRLMATAPLPSPAASAPILVPSGRAAAAMLGFADWCLSPPAMPLRLDLRVDGGAVKVDARSGIPVPGCMSAPQTPPPMMFLDSPLSVPGNPIAPPPNPVDSLPLRVTISAPATAAPGSELDYTVTISNQSTDGTAYDLAALCPEYSERLFLPGARAATVTRHMLNCRPAGVLEAGLSLTFAMRLSIPPDAPTGRAALVWMLGDLGPSAKAVFQIEP